MDDGSFLIAHGPTNVDLWHNLWFQTILFMFVMFKEEDLEFRQLIPIFDIFVWAVWPTHLFFLFVLQPTVLNSADSLN